MQPYFYPFQECVRFLCHTIAHKVVIILFCQRSSVYSHLNASLFSHLTGWNDYIRRPRFPHRWSQSMHNTVWHYEIPETILYSNFMHAEGVVHADQAVMFHWIMMLNLLQDQELTFLKAVQLNQEDAVAVWGNCFGSCFIFNSKAQAIGLNYSNRHRAVHNILHLFSRAVYSV